MISNESRILRLVAGLVILAWAVVTMLYVSSLGLSNVVVGRPFFISWRQITNAAFMMSAGATLTPMVFACLRRMRHVELGPAWSLLLYAVIGILYWTGWSLSLVVAAEIGIVWAPRLTYERALIAMTFISFTTYSVMVLLEQAVSSFQRTRREAAIQMQIETDLADARGAAMRASIDPAFIRDTFATASALIVEDARAARRVLSDMSDLLRSALGHDGEDLVAVREELELLERLVAISNTRASREVRLEIHLDPLAAGACVPPLLLQPLLRHLLEHRPRGEDGALRISVGVGSTPGELHISLTADWRIPQPPTTPPYAVLRSPCERLHVNSPARVSVSPSLKGNGFDLVIRRLS